MTDEQEERIKLTPQILNSIRIANLPTHDLKLKTDLIIILICNLHILESMCHEIRLDFTKLT